MRAVAASKRAFHALRYGPGISPWIGGRMDGQIDVREGLIIDNDGGVGG